MESNESQEHGAPLYVARLEVAGSQLTNRQETGRQQHAQRTERSNRKSQAARLGWQNVVKEVAKPPANIRGHQAWNSESSERQIGEVGPITPPRADKLALDGTLRDGRQAEAPTGSMPRQAREPSPSPVVQSCRQASSHSRD